MFLFGGTMLSNPTNTDTNTTSDSNDFSLRSTRVLTPPSKPSPSLSSSSSSLSLSSTSNKQSKAKTATKSKAQKTRKNIWNANNNTPPTTTQINNYTTTTTKPMTTITTKQTMQMPPLLLTNNALTPINDQILPVFVLPSINLHSNSSNSSNSNGRRVGGGGKLNERRREKVMEEKVKIARFLEVSLVELEGLEGFITGTGTGGGSGGGGWNVNSKPEFEVYDGYGSDDYDAVDDDDDEEYRGVPNTTQQRTRKSKPNKSKLNLLNLTNKSGRRKHNHSPSHSHSPSSSSSLSSYNLQNLPNTTQLPNTHESTTTTNNNNLNPPTPRVLKSTSSNNVELRSSLIHSLNTMNNLGATVKKEVIDIFLQSGHTAGNNNNNNGRNNMRNITNMRMQMRIPINRESHANAVGYLKKLSVEKIHSLLTLQRQRFRTDYFARWKNVVTLSRFHLNLTKYKKYQASRIIHNVMSKIHVTRVSHIWIRWLDFTLRRRNVEVNARHNKSIVIIQKCARRFTAVCAVRRLRVSLSNTRHFNAAVVIQSLTRGLIIRSNLCALHMDNMKGKMAVVIQCCYRCYKAVCTLHLLFDSRVLFAATVVVLRVMRGMIGRAKVRKLRAYNERVTNCVAIQRVLRGRFGRTKARSLQLFVSRTNASILISKHIRRTLALALVVKIKHLNYELFLHHTANAVLVQKVYRGHRGRVLTNVLLTSHTKTKARLRKNAVKIQRVLRGTFGRRRTKRLLKARYEAWLVSARAYKETWSDDSNAWFYYSEDTGEALWQPPRSGYTKHGAHGKLVLENGQVVDDPLNSLNLTVEEKGRLASEVTKLCVECESNAAKRHCSQCNDNYCTPCYTSTHLTHARALHTYTRIGPVECVQCESLVAVKWCVSCDDPFCGECYETVHGKGKRRMHAFCNIDRQGKVEAVTNLGGRVGVDLNGNIDGNGNGNEMVGNDIKGKKNSGNNGNSEYDADFNYNYNGDTGNGNGVGYASEYVNDEWTSYNDDDDNVYWYSNVTGESTYENPMPMLRSKGYEPLPPSQEEDDDYHEQYQVELKQINSRIAAASPNNNDVDNNVDNNNDNDNDNEWLINFDENNAEFWYNPHTGESTYNDPNAFLNNSVTSMNEDGSYSSGEVFNNDNDNDDDNDGLSLGGNTLDGFIGAEGWKVYYNEDGVEYFYNEGSGVSQYDRPGE